MEHIELELHIQRYERTSFSLLKDRSQLVIHTSVSNMIRFPDRDPTGFSNSEPDPDRTGFWKNSTGSDMDIQTALVTAVKCSIRIFSDINRIGSNIWKGLPD